MRARIHLGVFFVLLTILPGLAFAQQSEKALPAAAQGKSPGHCSRMANLTEEQKTKVQELMEEQRLRIMDLRADLQKLSVALRRELNKKEPDRKAIEETVKKMSAVREQMMMTRIENRLSLKKILGDDWKAFSGRWGFGCMEGSEARSCCREGDRGMKAKHGRMRGFMERGSCMGATSESGSTGRMM